MNFKKLIVEVLNEFNLVSAPVEEPKTKPSPTPTREPRPTREPYSPIREPERGPKLKPRPKASDRQKRQLKNFLKRRRNVLALAK